MGEAMNATPWALPVVLLTPPVTEAGGAKGVFPERKVTVPVGAFPRLSVSINATIIVPSGTLSCKCKVVVVLAWVMVTEVAVDVLPVKLGSPKYFAVIMRTPAATVNTPCGVHAVP